MRTKIGPLTARNILAVILAAGFVMSFSIPVWAAEEMTLEEISKTEAAKKFVTKDYPGALLDFEALEKEHPKSGVIKRYLASLHNSLREWDLAEQSLKAAIELDPADLIARQMLGDLYMKQGSIDLAESEFKAIKERSEKSLIGNYATQQLASIEAFRKSQGHLSKDQMNPQEFMHSEPARLFADGKFQDALAGFEKMQTEYPKDPLIHRFKGIALMRVKKYKEAEKWLREGVEKFPENIAMRYYLGESLIAAKKMEEARNELRWVIEHDRDTYELKAQQAMFLTLGQGAEQSKKWSLNFSNAYELDTNATYRSDDPDAREAGDQNAGRYTTLIFGTYRALQKGKWLITPDVLYSQSIYNDLINLNTYTPGFGVSALYGFSLFGRPTFLNIREGFTATWLRNRIYVYSNTLSNSLFHNWTANFRTNLSYRFGVSEFDNQGTAKDLTSRNGYSHTFGFTNTHYLNQAKTAYGNYGYDYERNDTHGKNYIKNAHTARFGLHFPIIEKIDGDLAYSFKNSDYPKYGFGPPRRQDDTHNVTATFSRPLFWNWLTLSCYYTYDNTRSNVNAYQYWRHLFGSKLSMQF